MPPATTYTFTLDPAQRERLRQTLREGNYILRTVPYADIAAEAPSWDCNVVLYTSGKCVVQGKGGHSFVENILEPVVLQTIVLSPDGSVAPPPLSAEARSAHIGVDESGKGDFLGPMVIAGVYTDEETAGKLLALGVRDSKAIASDAEALKLAAAIRALLGEKHFSVIRFGNEAYNRAYAKCRSVTRLLAWGHARCIENILEHVPDCPFAISDQFAREDTVRKALMARGRTIELRSRVRAEADPAVAAASILAREQFLLSIRELQNRFHTPIPKGASAAVRQAAETLVRQQGPAVLLQTAKCHFRTTDEVLQNTGFTRMDLPPEGRVLSVPYKRPGSQNA